MGIKSKIAYYLCVFLLSCSLAGCKADIDLSEVDWSTSVNASLSLPVGSIYAQMGDFLGVSQFPQITIDTLGRYVYMDTIFSSNLYHPIKIEDLMTNTSAEWIVADEFEKIIDQLLVEFPFIEKNFPNIKDLVSIPDTGFTIPIETCLYISEKESFTFSLDFPIDIDLTKLNTKFEYQRVDSIIVNMAHFTAAFTQKNFGLEWDDITKIDILLSDNWELRLICAVIEVLNLAWSNLYLTDYLLLHSTCICLLLYLTADKLTNMVNRHMALTLKFYYRTSLLCHLLYTHLYTLNNLRCTNLYRVNKRLIIEQLLHK